MKSAMVTRKGSTSRLQGPRSLTSFDGSPRKRSAKSVKFDKTDEVIQYTAATPDVSEDNWDQVSLESCELDADSRPLPTLPAFTLPPDFAHGSLTREERLMQMPQFRAKLGAPLQDGEDDFDFGPELPSPASSPRRDVLAVSALGSKTPTQTQENLVSAQQDGPQDVSQDVQGETKEAPDSKEASTEPSTDGVPSTDGNAQLLPPLESDMSPIIDRPPLELRMDAIMDGRSGMSPALNSGSWHRRTGSQMSDFSDGGNESYLPIKRIAPPKEEEEDAPAEWRGDNSSALARQDSLQDDQRHPPTQQMSTAPPPPPATVNRTYSKRKRQLQQMLDPHGAGTAQSAGVQTILEEDENEADLVEPGSGDLHVDIGDDSYWRGLKHGTEAENTEETSEETVGDQTDSSHGGNASEANQSIGISREPAAQFAAGLSPHLLDSQENTLESLEVPGTSSHEGTDGNGEQDSLPALPELLVLPALPAENELVGGDDSFLPHSPALASESRSSSTFDKSSEYSYQGAPSKQLDTLQEPSSTHSNLNDREALAHEPASENVSSVSESQDASRITYYDSADLENINATNDYSWDRSGDAATNEEFSPAPRTSSPKYMQERQAQPRMELKIQPEMQPVEPETEPEPEMAPEMAPEMRVAPAQDSPVAASSPKSPHGVPASSSSPTRGSSKRTSQMFPGALPWDPSGDTTYDYLASMPTPVIPQRSPERQRRSVLGDLSTQSPPPADSNALQIPSVDEPLKAEPKAPVNTESTVQPLSITEQQSSNHVLWEPEAEDVGENSADDGWEDDNSDYDDAEYEGSPQLSFEPAASTDYFAKPQEPELPKSTELPRSPDSLPSPPKVDARAPDSPAYSLPSIPQDDGLSEDFFLPTTEDISETQSIQNSQAPAFEEKSTSGWDEGSPSSLEDPEQRPEQRPVLRVNTETEPSTAREDIDPEILQFISDNEPSSSTSSSGQVARETADPPSEQSPEQKFTPHAYTVRQTSNSSLRKNFSFVPATAPTLSPVSISTSPFMSSKLEDEIKEQHGVPKASGIDELVTSPLPTAPAALPLPPTVADPAAGRSSNGPNGFKGHSASPSTATDNADTSILKEMSFNTEELAQFQQKSLMEDESREHEESLYHQIARKDDNLELDSDLSDLEPDTGANETRDEKPSAATLTNYGDSEDEQIGGSNNSDEHDELDNFAIYRTRDPKRDSAFSMMTAQSTVTDGNVSIREPSFGEDMASTMQTLLSDQFPPQAASQSDDQSSRRHSYTVRESGSYVIATSPQRKARGRSHVYEVFNEDDESAVAGRHEAPIPRNRPLPSTGSNFGTYSSLPRPPSSISQTDSSNYSLAQGSSSNSMAHAWWAGKAPQERKPLTAIEEPIEDEPPIQGKTPSQGMPMSQGMPASEGSELKSMRLRPSTKFANTQRTQTANAQKTSNDTSEPTAAVPSYGNLESALTLPANEHTHATVEDALLPPRPPAQQPRRAPEPAPQQPQRASSQPRLQVEPVVQPVVQPAQSVVPSVQDFPLRSGPGPAVMPNSTSQASLESPTRPHEKHRVSFAALDRTTSSPGYEFPMGLLYIAFKGIELATVSGDVLATLYIDNGVHSIASRTMSVSKLASFKEEYRIGFIENTPVTAVVKLSLPANQTTTSIKEHSCGSDGSFAKIDLQILRKIAFGTRQSDFELPGLGAWGANKQTVVAKAKADILYVPCVSRRERPPLTLGAVEGKILRARQDLRDRAPRAQGVLRQYGGDVSPKSGKQRYVVLDPIAPLLVAHSIRSRRARTLINLVKALEVKSTGDNSFEIHFRNRDALRFYANSRTEHDHWYRTLQACLGQSNNARPKWLDAVLYESR